MSEKNRELEGGGQRRREGGLERFVERCDLDHLVNFLGCYVGGCGVWGGFKKKKKKKVISPDFHAMPTNLNQLGRQSSLKRNFSPSVKRPVRHPLHLGELGQLK